MKGYGTRGGRAISDDVTLWQTIFSNHAATVLKAFDILVSCTLALYPSTYRVSFFANFRDKYIKALQ